ncbi:MAG: AraC family transcriptional regulator [Sphingomonas sp.]
MSTDPLAEIVTLLQPAARFSKLVECAGAWRIHRQSTGEPFYCAILEGECRIIVDGQAPMILGAGDFALVPAMRDLVNESVAPPRHGALSTPVEIEDGRFRVGSPDGTPALRMRIGHCSFGAPDAALLVPLLPQMVVARDESRLLALIQLVADETRTRRPARELVLQRLLEVLLIEALRCGAATASAPGLARGLADSRLAAALSAIHARPDHNWSVAALAAEAALSRSAFFDRFARAVGVAPMAYLLAWRMALAKRLLRTREFTVDQVAERVGYGSASTFSVAFARHAGMPPARYARAIDAEAA